MSESTGVATSPAPPSGPAATPRGGRPRRGAGGRRPAGSRRGWMFVGPFMVVFALVFLAPIGYAFWLSLFQEQAFFGGTRFVGAANYVAVLQDPKFWESFLRVLLFLVVQVPVMLTLALVAALAIDSAQLRARGFFRVALFLPYAVPGVVAVLMWGYIYGDSFGLAADLNRLLGTDVIRPLSSTWILASIGNIVTWEFVGYNMVIFYSALRAIPETLYEAAALDGAGPLRTVFFIKIPSLRGAILIATIFSILGSFQLFNEPNILRTLAPNQISSYFTPNMYAYSSSFAGQQYNYAATIALVMGVLTAAIAYAVQLRGNRGLS